MEVKAKLRNIRVGSQKARWVADMVRGKDVSEAVRILSFLPQKSAIHFKKLIESAAANAEVTKKVDVDSLYVKAITVDMAPSYRRFRPRAQGRAYGIAKKASHFNVVLEER